jgi:hypothetical protein
MVPDLAGWKEERYPDDEPHNWITVSPDWVCETLSHATRMLDRMKKIPIYAQKVRAVPFAEIEISLSDLRREAR